MSTPRYSSDDIHMMIMTNNFPLVDTTGMENWENYGFLRKDVYDGQILKVKKFGAANPTKIYLECNEIGEVECSLKKDIKFFNYHNIFFNSVDGYVEWINTGAANNWLETNEISLSILVNPINKSYTGSLLYSYFDTKRDEFFKQIKNSTKTYTAKIISRNGGGYIAQVDGVNVFLPGSLASANKIINFEDLIGRTINVMIEDYLKDSDTFVVSNKKWLKMVLPKLITSLSYEQEYKGIVTGASKFGIFLEFEEYFTGLLHVSEMNEELKALFDTNKILPGNVVSFYIKEIGKNDRIILSSNQRKNYVSIDEFRLQCEGKSLSGTVVNSTPSGYYVQFDYNENIFSGVVLNKDLHGQLIKQGQEYVFYIAKVDTDTKKIFLKLHQERT